MSQPGTNASVGEALQKIESFQYPATHLGHLSPTQEDSLAVFKKLAEQKRYYRPETSSQKASHDDETMLRYLRARKFSPEDAFGQFKDTEDWRRENKIEELYNTIEVSDFEEARSLYPQWTGRRDKRGIPVYTFEVAHLTAKRMAAYEKSASKQQTSGTTPAKLLRLFALYENLLNFAFPLCSGVPDRPYAETPVSQSNNIVDIAGVGLKQFWNLRQHMQDASQLATAHYPETLDRIFVIGAPSFFPTIWSWVKGWFDPITVSKIFILSKSNMKSTLEQYIDRSNIPQKYGGTLDWEWGEPPTLEPSLEKSLEWIRPTRNKQGQNIFPPGPIRWRTTESGDLLAVAVGSENGKVRELDVARLPVKEGVTLGPVSSRLAVEHTLFGQPSTTGVHTHPEEGQDYFPVTGVTPPDEHDDGSLQRAMHSEQNHSGVPARSSTGDSNSRTANVPADTSSHLDQHRSQLIQEGGPTRAGTSSTRYEAQAETSARGQLTNSTPDSIDHGYSDRTRTIEPGTVGQAHKDVTVPDATPSSTGDQQQQPGYLEQAKNAASGAAVAVGGAGSAMMATVGLGGSSGPSEKHVEDEKMNPQELPVRQKEDPRVDKMDDKNVEEFIRSQYSSANKVGNRKVDKLDVQ